MLKGEYPTRTKDLVSAVRNLTDDQLRAMFRELEIGKSKSSGAALETHGERVMHADVIIILGAERGLWDQAGYPLGCKKPIDFEYSRKMEGEFLSLVEAEYSLLVFFLLDMKQNVSRMDDLALTLIERAVRCGTWRFDRENETLIWRLKTIGLAARVILSERGYQIDEIE